MASPLVRHDGPRLPILWFTTLDGQVNRPLSTERLLAALSDFLSKGYARHKSMSTSLEGPQISPLKTLPKRQQGA
ncbi:MAG TPA: hypothetical protein VHW24_16735 [Bryobacteraceae bacterium]|nr:hypothetical protein [Bryobacteraceae bacterium]